MEWKNVNFITPEIQEYLDRLDVKQKQIANARPFPDIALRRIKENMAIEWTYNSNSIEGNTFSLQETKMVLQDGITVGGKSLREHFETVNHKEGIDFIYDLVHPKYNISERDILSVHELVMSKIEKKFAGRFRNAAIRITGANFTPPNALRVHDFIADLVEWVNHETKDVHPIIKATMFHHRFVFIHPFFDGNGRTVRLLFNLFLMKAGFPPAIILKNDRKKYYDALKKCDGGDYSKLLLMVAQSMERSLNIYLSSTDNSYPEYQPIQQIVEEQQIPYGQEYISLLARRGKIDAHKEGNSWYTTKSAVTNYMDTRKRKRKAKV
jgi:Fic family protein